MSLSKRLAALAGGVSLAALAGQAYVEHRARATVEEMAALVESGGATVTRGRVSVDVLSGRIRLTGFGVEEPAGLKVRVGSVTFSGPFALVSPAQAAGDVKLDDVAVTFGDQSYEIKSLTFSGTDNSREELAAIFDKAATAPLSERLRRISAQSVSSPEIVMKQKRGEITTSVLYRDVRLAGLANGVAASFATATGAFASQGGEDNIAATFGPVTATGIDLVQIARVYNEQAAPGETELKTVYATFAVEGIAGTAGKGSKFAIARLGGRNFKMKPGKEPWLATLKDMAGERDAANLPPEERAKLVNAMADMMESFSVELMEATGITGGDGSDPQAPTVRLNRIAYEGAAMGKPNVFRIEGLEVQAKEGSARIGEITHSGWSYAPTLAALRESLGKPDADLENLPVRRFIPRFGTFSIRDVDLDVPDEKAREKNPSAPNIRGGLKLFEIAAGSEVEGVPTALRITMDRLTAALPPGSQEEGVKDLVALGYKDLDLSMGFDGRWDQASNDVFVNNLGVQGVNMGSVAVRGVLGNVTKDVFSGDATAAQIALLGATVKGMTLSLDNKGLFERLLEREAKKQKKSPDQMRKEFGAMAQIGIPQMLGGGAQAKQVGAAVAKFLMKPNRLTIEAKAKDPSGLGIADFMGAGNDPQAFLASVDLAAKAD